MHVFIGCDRHHRLAALVLAHSLQRRCSLPITITLLEQHQLEQAGLYWRSWDSRQSTDFSFSRFLVPALMGFQGWGLYLDGDMLCLADPAELWHLCDANEALLCVQHPSHRWGHRKMAGLPQTDYPRKNWSSLMLFNAARCGRLTPDYVNQAPAMDLHRFAWLDGADPGGLPRRWNHLVDLDPPPASHRLPALLHWTLGGPWLPGCAEAGSPLADLWRADRDDLLRQLNG